MEGTKHIADKILEADQVMNITSDGKKRQTDTPNERLSAEYFLCVPEEGSSGVFVNSREVLGRFELEPGYYVLIPATYYPDQTRTFMLRIFGLKPFDVKKLPDQEILIHEQDAFVEEIT